MNDMVTTRKDHTCDYCWRTIKKGTKSISAKYTPWTSDNDSFGTFRAHLKCDAAWRIYDREAWMHGELPEGRGVDFKEILDFATDTDAIRFAAADIEAIRSDWEAIGKDLRDVIGY